MRNRLSEQERWESWKIPAMGGWGALPHWGENQRLLLKKKKKTLLSSQPEKEPAFGQLPL